MPTTSVQKIGAKGQVTLPKHIREATTQMKEQCPSLAEAVGAYLAMTLDRLADRLSTEMMVEYLVPNGSKPVDVRVGVRIPGARVRGLGVAPR